MPQMQTNQPARKVYAGTIAGALTTVIVWLLRDLAGLSVPEPVAVALTTLIVFLAGYYMPPSEMDQVVVPPQEKGLEQ